MYNLIKIFVNVYLLMCVLGPNKDLKLTFKVQIVQTPKFRGLIGER